MLSQLLLTQVSQFINLNIIINLLKKELTYYPNAMHSSLTSSPAIGASGNAFGKLLGNFNC